MSDAIFRCFGYEKVKDLLVTSICTAEMFLRLSYCPNVGMSRVNWGLVPIRVVADWLSANKVDEV